MIVMGVCSHIVPNLLSIANCKLSVWLWCVMSIVHDITGTNVAIFWKRVYGPKGRGWGWRKTIKIWSCRIMKLEKKVSEWVCMCKSTQVMSAVHSTCMCFLSVLCWESHQVILKQWDRFLNMLFLFVIASPFMTNWKSLKKHCYPNGLRCVMGCNVQWAPYVAL